MIPFPIEAWARSQIAPSDPMRGSCEPVSGLDNSTRDDAGFPCKALSPTRSVPRFLSLDQGG